MVSTSSAVRLAEERICINARHPGGVNSALDVSYGIGGQQCAEKKANAPPRIYYTMLAIQPTCILR